MPTVHGCPDVCPVFRDEVCFIDSYSNPRFLFDDGVPVDSRSSVTALITKAIDTRLRQGECDSLLAQLRIDPSLADDVAIPSAKIASLIENNPEIAKEVILASVKKPGVVKAVLGADVTLASVDVVKHLIVSRQAPGNFIETYIMNSTKALAVIQNQQLRGRKARFFCKMITFIIQSGEKLTPTMIMDLNSFCVEKAKTVKEAQELNTLLMNYTRDTLLIKVVIDHSIFSFIDSTDKLDHFQNRSQLLSGRWLFVPVYGILPWCASAAADGRRKQPQVECPDRWLCRIRIRTLYGGNCSESCPILVRSYLRQKAPRCVVYMELT